MKKSDNSSGNAGRETAATKLHKSTADQIALGDSHFLSKTNPIATADQRDMEVLAIEVLQMPIITQAKVGAAQRFKILVGRDVPEEAWARFDDVLEEWAFHYVLLALNSDSNYPRVLSGFFGPPHEWFGMKVPGSRGPGTGENVDGNYSFIPVNGHTRLELRGRKLDPAIGDCSFHISSNLTQSMNGSLLSLVSEVEWRNVSFNPDGTFVITIGPEPANGRHNHLQTTWDSRYLFIRERKRDWRQAPNAYRIERLDPPTAPPLSIEQMAALAARFMVDDVGNAYRVRRLGPQTALEKFIADDTLADYWLRRMASFLEVNTLSGIAVDTDMNGKPTQKLLRGRLKLADDEAYVLTLGPGEAKYWVLVLYDFWLMSGNFWSRQSSLNNTQSVANADGSTTCVFSLQDPGVHNWIDTLGLHEPLFMNRWRMLPQTAGGPGAEPWAKGQLVKLKDIDKVLPPETKRVTPEERKQQLAERLAAFNLRYAV